MAPPKLEPGRDPQMAERTRKLNVLFALTSIALLVTFSLMIWDDYDREWKKYQVEFNEMESERTRAAIQEADTKVDPGRKKELEEKITRAEAESDQREKQIDEVDDEIEKLDGEWYRVDQDYRFTKARIDVARY